MNWGGGSGVKCNVKCRHETFQWEGIWTEIQSQKFKPNFTPSPPHLWTDSTQNQRQILSPEFLSPLLPFPLDWTQNQSKKYRPLLPTGRIQCEVLTTLPILSS